MARLLLGTIVFAASAAFAQNVDYSVNVGGISPPITHPQVMGFDSLSGKYQHVVLVSIDGFHQVPPHQPRKFTCRVIWPLMSQ